VTKEHILKELKKLQPLFSNEGVNILGLFGSYSRDEATQDSDIDILIETTPKFLKNNIGWDALVKLDELKEILKEKFNKDIDFANKQGLLDHNNTYILNKTIYV
jgi:predicted nucleotidyltransferase